MIPPCCHVSATFTFILANNREDAVDMFKVSFPSPPVPQVSMQFSTLTLLDLSLSTETPPAISSETSPLLINKLKNYKISSSFTFPFISISKASMLSIKDKFFYFLVLLKTFPFYSLNKIFKYC